MTDIIIKQRKTTKISKVVAEMGVALGDLRNMSVCKLKQPLFWESYYAALRDPKTKSVVPHEDPLIQESVISDLERNNIKPVSLVIDINDYKKYIKDAEYKKFAFYYFKFARIGKILVEKSLEHYLAAQLLKLSKDDVYMDVASSVSPTPEIYEKLYDCESFRQDLVFPPGINGNVIGGDAGNIPVPDGFASKMALHCAFEHFEGDSDIRFIKEASRILKDGGKLCILPLYLSNKYSIQTNPIILPKGGLPFETDATLFCAKHHWGNRHSRFYDVSHFINRIVNNMGNLKLTIFVVKNENQVDPKCYVKFIALFEKVIN